MSVVMIGGDKAAPIRVRFETKPPAAAPMRTAHTPHTWAATTAVAATKEEARGGVRGDGARRDGIDTTGRGRRIGQTRIRR